MIISDIDYLHSITETDVIHLNGGDAVTISKAWTIAYGSSTASNIVIKNQAISKPRYSFSASSVSATSKSSDGTTISYASSSSSSG